jgi:hypothetical protein
MIKNFGLLARRADVSVEYFHWHWREVHGPLALRITAVRRYVQSHRLRAGVTGFPTLHQEGVAEVWVDDLAAALGLATNPEFTDHAGPDEAYFLDRNRSLGMKCEERVLLDGPPVGLDDSGVKALLFVTALTDGSERLNAWLEDQLLPVAGSLPAVRRIVVDRPVPGAPVRAPYSAVIELCWPNIAAYDRGWSSRAGTDLLHALGAVADLPASAATLVEEHRLR